MKTTSDTRSRRDRRRGADRRDRSPEIRTEDRRWIRDRRRKSRRDGLTARLLRYLG